MQFGCKYAVVASLSRQDLSRLQASSIDTSVSKRILCIYIGAKRNELIKNSKSSIRFFFGIINFKAVEAIYVPTTIHNGTIDCIVYYGSSPRVRAGLIPNKVHVRMIFK